MPDLPLHLTISDRIGAWIDSGMYRSGDRLPSETQLMAKFAVSRITIRRAISNLSQQGLVESRQGKGVFVKKQQRAIYSLSSPFVWFNEDMMRQGLTSTLETIVFEAVAPSEKVRQKLHLPANVTEVYLQKKFFIIDNTIVALDITYILSDLGEAYGDRLKQQMTFPLLEEVGVSIDRIEAILSSRQADRETARILGLKIGSPLLVYDHTAFGSYERVDGDRWVDRPILCGETLSSGDRLAYSIVFNK